jgi:hypothetical protein
MVNPWHSKSEDQKRYVEDTFGRILRGYLMDDETSTILFSWVMSNPFMFELIVRQLDGMNYTLHKIALVCDKQPHIDRMRRDRRRAEQASNPDTMKPYHELGARVIDVSRTSAQDAAKLIKEAIDHS